MSFGPEKWTTRPPKKTPTHVCVCVCVVFVFFDLKNSYESTLYGESEKNSCGPSHGEGWKGQFHVSCCPQFHLRNPRPNFAMIVPADWEQRCIASLLGDPIAALREVASPFTSDETQNCLRNHKKCLVWSPLHCHPNGIFGGQVFKELQSQVLQFPTTPNAVLNPNFSFYHLQMR